MTSTLNGFEIIDGDGHVLERDEELVEFLDEPYRGHSGIGYFPFFPTLDGLHRGAGGARRGKPDVDPDPMGWIDFMDRAGITSTVLYPTAGLGAGMIQDPDWAVAVCRAYNDWLHELFVKTSDRFNGVALLPAQDPVEAAKELRRSVTELGMVGGMLCANSADMGVRKPLGDPDFWPIYAEAERLDRPIAVHGAPSIGLGANMIGRQAPIVEHVLAQIVQMTNMLLSGLYDEYPKLRIGYLEADTGWVPYMMDRLTGRADPSLTDPAEVLASGRVFFSCQSEEQSLRYAVERLGDDVVLYASDYWHEPAEEDIEDIQTLAGREDLSLQTKRKIFKDNTLRFYGMTAESAGFVS